MISVLVAISLPVASVFRQGGVGNRVSVVISVVAGSNGRFHPVVAGLATAQQALDLFSEPLVDENVNKWIHRRIARDQDNRREVGDVPVGLRRTEVV